ncbi:squalene/phytoene synthase family protein [Maritimibacter sp. 55A14]|uniref:phytoene/squalene synthase family protein n=1 Tax=Maritimibacter sp. 55A14 TaxID=2174844 RepID=UPI001E3FD60D|nr:squalene/phytoene synthase family protein [Maritimibacter sp. 55A14]
MSGADFDACAELVERGDPDRFLSVMTAPPARRGALMALYAFNIEVSRAPWVTAEPMIAEMRLQWWHDALEEIAAGASPRAHEVVTPLAEVVAEHGLPVAALSGLVAARRGDIYPDPPADRAAFDAYLDATSGNLMWLAAKVLGAAPEAEAPVRDFAYGAGLAAYLRAVPELEARGQRPLPDGREIAVADLAGEGLARIAAARRARGRVGRAAIPALLAGWRADATLRAARRDPNRVKSGRLTEPEAQRRLSLFLRSLTGRW